MPAVKSLHACPHPLQPLSRLLRRWVAVLAFAGLSFGPLSAVTWDNGGGDGLWSNLDNWVEGTSPAGQAVIFGDAGAAATAGVLTSVLDASGTFTISSLRFQHNGASLFHTLEVGTGKTLLVNGTGGFKVGVGSYNTGNIGTANNTNTHVTLTGGGTLEVNNISGLVEVGMPSALESSTNRTTLDLAGLGAFNANVNELRVAWGRTNQATLTLSNVANDITANAIQVSNSAGQNPGTGVMVLGAGTNILRVTSLNLGLGKGNGTLRFASQTAGSPGTVVIQGKTTGSAANITLASAGDSTGFGLVGLLDLRGHEATVTAGDVIVGRRGGNNGGTATGTIRFDQGTFTVDNLTLGYRQQDISGTGGKATGTLEIGGGVFTINEGGSAVLGTRVGTAGSATAEGIITLSGGELISHVDIQHGGGVGATSTINMLGGTFDLTGHQLGDATNQITTLNLRHGTLRNIGEVNGGLGALTITGSTGEVVVLEGVNTYTGGTSLGVASRLEVGSGGTSGSLGSGNVTLAANAVIGFNRSNLMKVENVISGNFGSVEQIGSGRTVLGGANTYRGTTTVLNGVLEVSTLSAIANTERIVVADGAAFYLLTGSGGTASLTQIFGDINLDLEDGAIIGLEVGGTLNSGTVGARTAGDVELRLFGYSGLSTIPASTTLLQAGSGLSDASYTLYLYNNTNFTATLDPKTDTQISASLTSVTGLAEAWWMGGRVAGRAGEWAVSDGTTSNWAADQAGATTAVVPGQGTLVHLSATGGDASAMSLGADMEVGGLSIESTGPVLLQDANYILTLHDDAAITHLAGAGAAELAVALEFAGTAPVIDTGSTNALTLSGQLQGSQGFLKQGLGTLILSGTESNLLTGTIRVQAGVLELAKQAGSHAVTDDLEIGNGATVLLRASHQIDDSSRVTVESGGLLRLNSFSEVIGGLDGSGAVENAVNGTTSVFTVGGGDADGTFYGILRNGGAGPVLAFTKVGAGTQILGGAEANTYSGLTTVVGGVLALNKTPGVSAISGNTTVAGGTLRLMASDQILDSGSVTIAGGGVFDLGGFAETVAGLTLDDGSIVGTGTLRSNAQYVTRNGSISANLTGNVGFRKEGTGTVSLSGVNTFTGTVKVDRGVLKVLGNHVLGIGTNLVELSGDSAQGRNPTLWLEGGHTVNIGSMRTSGTGNSGATPGVIYNFSGVNTINVAGDISLTAGNGSSTYYSESGIVILNAARLRATDTNRALTLTGPGNGIINASIENGVTAAMPITKSGTGMWIFTGANTYTGATNVSGGTLRVTNAAGLSGTSRLTVGSNASFQYQSGVAGNNLTVAALTLNNNSRLGLELGNTMVVGAGGASTGTSAVTVDLFGITGHTYAAGAYQVLAASSGLSGATYSLGLLYNATNFTLDTTQGTGGISKSDTAVTVHLTAADELETAFWKGGFTGGGGTLGHVWSVSNGTSQSNWVTDTGADTPLVPGANTSVVFSAAGAANQAAPMVLGADMAVGSVTFNDASPVVLEDALYQLTLNHADAITVTGTGAVSLSTRLQFAAPAVNVSVASGGSLTLGGMVSGVEVTKTGEGTLTFSGMHASGITGLFTVAGGVLELGKAENVNAIAGGLRVQAGAVVRWLAAGQVADASDVEVQSGGELDLAGYEETFDALSGAGQVTTSIAGEVTLTLGAGGGTGDFSGVLEDGAGVLSLTKTGSGVQVLSGGNTYSGLTRILDGTLRYGASDALPVGGLVLVDGVGATWDLAGYAGTVGGVTLANGTITGGEVSVVTSTTAFDLQNGVVNARLAGNVALNKTTTGTVTLQQQSTYTGGTFIRQGTLVVGGINALPTDGAVFVGESGSAGALQVNEDQSILSLRIQGNTTDVSQVTIASGKTLTISGSGSLKVGLGSGTVQDPYVLGGTTKAVFDGGGNLRVENTAGILEVGVRNADQNANENVSELDLRGLGSFHAEVNVFRVAYESRNNAVLRLSNTSNTIIANTVSVGNSNVNNAGGAAQMYLGTGENIIRATTLDVGRGKTPNALLTFGGTGGTVLIEGKTSGALANINIGVATEVDTAATIAGTLNLNGHEATVKADVLTIGRRTRGGSGGASGTLSFNEGVFTANQVLLASRTAGASVSGTLNIGGGTFTVNSGAGSSFVIATGDSTNGHLNLTGGVLTSHVDIEDGGGTGTSRITVDGGTLDLQGNSLGGATNAINQLNFLSGVLKNVDKINDSAGVTKTGAGKTLKLEGDNYYTGATQVNAGTFLVNGTHGDASGSQGFAGAYTAASGTVVGGSGTVHLASGANFTVQTGARLRVGDDTLGTPAASTFTITTRDGGALVLETGTFVEFDLISSGSGGLNQGDALALVGDLDIGATVTLELGNPNSLTSWVAGDTWRLFDWTGVTGGAPAEGTFQIGTSFDNLLTGTGLEWDLTDLYAGGTISIAPEPGRMLLLLVGVLGCVMRRQRVKGGRV